MVRHQETDAHNFKVQLPRRLESIVLGEMDPSSLFKGVLRSIDADGGSYSGAGSGKSLRKCVIAHVWGRDVVAESSHVMCRERKKAFNFFFGSLLINNCSSGQL